MNKTVTVPIVAIATMRHRDATITLAGIIHEALDWHAQHSDIYTGPAERKATVAWILARMDAADGVGREGQP